MSLFNNPNPFAKPASQSFGSIDATSQPSGPFQPNAQAGSSIFNTQKPFGTATQTQTLQPPMSNLFAPKPPQQQSGSVFGGGFGGTTTQQTQQPPQQQSMFGGSQQQQQPQQSMFGGIQQQQQPQQSMFGGSQQQQQQQQQQQPQPQTNVTPSLTSSVWKPGSGLNALNRNMGEQLDLISSKWRPDTQNSAFTTYLYNYVGEAEAPFYAPKEGDDLVKWEEALQKRPGPGYIPVLARGFSDLGERLKRQNDYLRLLRGRLHEINDSLTEMLRKHDLHISVQAADCRRKHLVLSQRCLALATKAQVMKNRGFGMDTMEEELKLKLERLERHVFDPTLNGRAEEIWARMLAIRELSRALQAHMDRYGPGPAKGEGVELDEAAVKFAKAQLEEYSEQLQHLNKELALIKTDFEEWESTQKPQLNGTSRTRQSFG